MSAPATAAPEEQQTQVQPDIPVELAAEERKPRRSNTELLDLIVKAGDRSQQFATAVVEAELDRDLFDQDQRLAMVFATSGEFADLKTKSPRQAIATAMAKIQLGRAWNVNPADSMQFLYFTNGRPALMTELFAARLQDAGYDWDVGYEYDDKGKCTGCTIWPKKLNPATRKHEPMMRKVKGAAGSWGDAPLEVSFTKADADGAMIWEKGKQVKLSEKWNFQSWSEDMYFWRAISRFRRRHVPNVLSGAMTREEAEETAPVGGQADAPRLVQREDPRVAALSIAAEKLAEITGEPRPADAAPVASAINAGTMQHIGNVFDNVATAEGAPLFAGGFKRK